MAWRGRINQAVRYIGFWTEESSPAVGPIKDWYRSHWGLYKALNPTVSFALRDTTDEFLRRMKGQFEMGEHSSNEGVSRFTDSQSILIADFNVIVNDKHVWRIAEEAFGRRAVCAGPSEVVLDMEGMSPEELDRALEVFVAMHDASTDGKNVPFAPFRLPESVV